MNRRSRAVFYSGAIEVGTYSLVCVLQQKISELLFIKKLKPDLNVQKESLRLFLYN